MAKKILIVDDDENVRELIKDILGMEDYNCIESVSGEDMLKRIRKERNIDLIILDYTLPDINGDKLIKILNRKKIKIPVILVSGLIENFDFKDDSNIVKGKISKPFEIDDFINKVKNTIIE